MEFKLTKIDPYNCTLDELEKEIERLSDLKDEYKNKEQSIKIYLNSIYGALASPFFIGYNHYIAEAVTLQGQDIIKYANKTCDEYFLKYWHKDKELHKALGLTRVDKIQSDSICIYNDTDSTYITLKPLLDSCDAPTEKRLIDFILKLKDLRLYPFIDQRFKEYAKKRNTDNLQVFELEKISYSGLMMAKKKYVLDLAWKDPGIFYEPQQKISPTGVEIVQGSTPPFARRVLKELLNVLFAHGKEINYSELVKKIREYKRTFVMQDPEDISKTVSVGDYEKYILEDKNKLVFAPKCPIGIRGAGIHNHELLNNKWKGKYNLIRTGDKIKHYYCKGQNDVFAFLPGNYPYEFAPEVDHDVQFTKIIIEPFNRFIQVLGLNGIPESLSVSKSLF